MMPDFAWTDLLPGLYLAGLTTLLAAALRRWYDPLPRQVLLAFGAVVVLLFGRALFLGGILLPLDNLRSAPPFQDLPSPGVRGFHLQVDQLEDFAPYYAQVRRTLARGEWPLTNPLVGAGEPLLVNSQAQHFHPFMVLGYPFPLPAAVGLVAAMKVLTALVFTFLLFRRLGLSEPPALAGSLAYGMGGFMLLYLGWPQTQAAALLPVLLYALERVIGVGARPDTLLLGLASAGLLLGGHPETIVYAAGTGFAFALARLAARGWRTSGRPLARIALTVGLSAAALAPVLLPTALYLGKSERFWLVETRRPPALGEELHARLGTAAARRREAAELARRTVPLVAPAAYGHNRYGRYWGATAITQDASGFFGSAAVLAAALALLPGCRRFPAERLTLGLGAASFLFVAQPPGLASLTLAVPGLAHSASQNRRLALVICFCGAYLAACTWERWRRRGLRRPAVLAAAVLLGAVVLWAYLAHPCPGYPDALKGVRFGFLAAHLLTLAAAAWLLSTAPGRRPWMPWALALLVAAELGYVHGDLNPPMPKRLYFPTTPAIEYLQRHLGDARLVGVGKTFRHNVPVIYGLADVRSGNPLQPASLFLVTRPLRASRNSRTFVVADHPLYDLLGVRYVVTGPQERAPAPLKLVYWGNMRVYERPGPLPRLFLPASAEVARDRFFRRIHEHSDFAGTALLLPSEARDGWRAADPAASSLEILRLGATRIEARAVLTERRLLASSIYQDGGWRLLADGRRVATLRVNGPFVGGWLEPGERRLELVYRPPGFLAGCVVAALALAAAFAVWIPRPPSGLRRSPCGSSASGDGSGAGSA